MRSPYLARIVCSPVMLAANVAANVAATLAPLVAASSVVCALPRSARAYEADVDSTSTAQAYQLRGLGGDPVLSRRRVTETLSLGVYKLTDEETSDAAQWFVRARMRVDIDFGMNSAETTQLPSIDTTRFIPGLTPAPVDVMYAYLEGRRLLHGLLGVKLGRQYLIDALGYWSFDGALAKIVTPLFFQIETYAGFEVRGGLPLSSGRFELGGVERVDRTLYGSTQYASYQNATLAPAYGAAIETTGLRWLHLRATYRRAYDRGASFVAGTSGALVGPDAIGIYDQTRLASERLGVSADAQVGSIASAHAIVAWDLISSALQNVEANVDVALNRKITAGIDYSFWRPIFDGDSIFSVFGVEPMDDLAARVLVEATDELDISADARVRRYLSDDVNDLTRVASEYAPGGSLRMRYRWTSSRAGFRAYGLTGDQGTRVGADLDGEKTIDGRYLLDARVSLWRFDDKLHTEASGESRSATSLGYVLGAGYKVAPAATLSGQWEHDINRLVGQRFRLLAVLRVRLGP